MKYKELYIFVEGNDDERFFRIILVPMLEKYYNIIRLWKYTGKPYKKVNDLLRSLKKMSCDYIMLADINHEPCISLKKQKILKKYNKIEENKVIVVTKEVESWYLAGLSDTKLQEWRISPFQTTDNINKEKFKGLIPKKYSKIDFMVELLKHYCPKTAIKKNRSFKYFIEKNKLKV